MKKHLTKPRILALGIGVLVLGALVFGLSLQTATAGNLTVTGKVVGPGGGSLTNASGNINLQPTDPNLWSEGGHIENDGTFEVRNVSAGQYQVEINYDGASHCSPAPFDITITASNTNLGSIKLTKCNLTGYIVDENSNRYSDGVNVNINSHDGTYHSWSNPDAQGNFKFGGLSVGNYSLEISASQESKYARTEYEVEITNPNVTKDLGAVQIQLPNVTGRIVKPGGAPIELNHEENEWINVNLRNDEFNFHQGTSADDDGSFKLGQVVKTGDYTLEVSIQGTDYTAPADRTFRVVKGTLKELGDIRLTNPTLKGIVSDPNGQPVRDANIEVHNEDWSRRQSTNTNEQGRYAIGGLANGTYIMEVRVPWDRSDLIDASPMNVTLTEGSVLTKNVTLTNAVKFLEVTVVNNEGLPVYAQVNANKENGHGWANGETNARTGKATLSVTPGDWRSRVEHPWSPSGETPAWMPTDSREIVTFANNNERETKQLTIVVYKADASITGKLTTEDGSPLMDIETNAHSEDGAGVNARTDANGRFTLKLRSGSYNVNFWTDRNDLAFPEFHISLKTDEAKDLGTIVAEEKKARITAIIADKSGTPVPNIWINTWKRDGHEWSNAQSQDDGTVVIPVVGEGEYELNIDQGRSEEESRYVNDGPPIEVEVPTKTSSVDVGKIKLEYADVTITGYVVVAGTDNPVSNFWSWMEAFPATTDTIGGHYRGFGGPVDGNNGSFSVNVPSNTASMYTLTVHTPEDSEYSPADEKIVAVWSDATITTNVEVMENDASIVGQLQDQNGQPITDCSVGEDADEGHHGNWIGDVHADQPDKHLWRNAQIRPDCTYDMSLLSGEWHLGYWMDHQAGFLSRPPNPDPVTIKKGENVINLTAIKADATINITVKDPNGDLVEGKMWVHAGNWMELEKEYEDKEDMTDDDWQKIHENELHTDTEIMNGKGELPVLSGHTWGVDVGIPADLPYIAPGMEEVNLKTGTSKNITFVLEEATGQMSGVVSISQVPVNQGWVWCVQKDEGSEKGGSFSGGPVEWEGQYALNYGDGKYHCGADSFVGNEFWRSEEETITTTGQASVKKDWSLGKFNFEVPEPVIETFPADQAKVIKLGNDDVTINIPAQALAEEGNVTVEANPTLAGLLRDWNTEPWGVGYDLTARDADNTEITEFTKNVTITFKYTDEQVEEFGLDIAALTGKYIDETTNSYRDPNGTTHARNDDDSGGTITISVDHFTTFVIASTNENTGGVSTAAGGPYNLIATAAKDGGPQVGVYNKDGQLLSTWFAYPADLRLGMEAFAADLDGNGEVEVVTYPTQGFPSQVRVFDKNGTVLSQFFAYDPGYKDGINVTALDLDGDGAVEIITSPAANAAADVRTYDRNGTLLGQFNAYGDGYTLGAGVAAADLNGDGTGEIVTYPQSGSGQVRVFNSGGSVLAQFNTYGDTYRNGINLTMADMDGDGTVEIITGTKNTVPQVKTFDANGGLLNQFYGYAETFQGGVVPQVGDVDADGESELVILPGTDGAAQARVFDKDGNLLSQFFGYPTHIRGSFEVVLGDLDGNGEAEIIFAPQEGLGPQARIFNKDGSTLSQFFTLHTGFRGGIHLGLITQ